MNFANLIVFIPLLLVAMTVHEASHALMSHLLGDSTAKREGRLSLNPFVHIDPVFTILVPGILIALGQPPILAAKPVPFDPHSVRFGDFGAALVALAGPLSNLVLAIITALALPLFDVGLVKDIVGFFLLLNVSLAIFNLVPWPPLDGSRVLYAFAPRAVQVVMNQIEALGISGLFIFIFIAWRFVSPFVVMIEEYILRILT
jgi:Zn-dependent protease